MSKKHHNPTSPSNTSHRPRSLLPLLCWTLLSLSFLPLSALAQTAASPSAHLQPFEVLEGCTLKPTWARADRIVVTWKDGKEFHFQLYYVQTLLGNDSSGGSASPANANDSFATYFGITPAEATVAAREAVALAQRFLAKPFTVRTRWEEATLGAEPPSYYAFVTTSEPQDFAELLVGSGLARIFGPTTPLPDGTTPKAFLTRLKTLETAAKSHRQGAWRSNRDAK